MTQSIGIDATYQADLATAMKAYGQELVTVSRRTDDFDTADMLYTIGIQYLRDSETMANAPVIGSGFCVAVEQALLNMAHTAMIEMITMAAEDAQSLRDQADAKDAEADRLVSIMEHLGL